MRIENLEQITNHGNTEGRQIVAQIMQAGLEAADPYNNARLLLHRDGDMLYVGDSRFEADGDPRAGVTVIDLKQIEHIWVVGAGKGVQRVALAVEEALGERITDGCLIAKYGDDPCLSYVRVVYGAHPVPDENCVRGCEEILKLAQRVTERDVVFTIIGNGCSSLLTLPEDGVSLDDVRQLTRMMQIERGVPTVELNIVRNHVDKLKGGKLSRFFSKAKQIHLVITDANHHVIQDNRHDYDGLLRHNVWLHNLPEGSTFAQAVDVLKRYNAWDACPESIKKVLLDADCNKATVKYEEFSNYDFRVFGIMPDSEHFLPAARRKAEALGLPCYILTRTLQAESRDSAIVLSAIARDIAMLGEPFRAPVVLLSSGEMLVTVENAKGVGGRNQEFALTFATKIAGCPNIVAGSADSDGTDGPGGLDLPGAPVCLGGGLVDGFTMTRAREIGVDVRKALSEHATSEALWRLDDGMFIRQNISLNDLTVIWIGAVK